MLEKTMIMRKKGYWYVLNSNSGDEKGILLTLLEYAEHEHFNIGRDDVYTLMEKLGWKLEVYIPGLGVA
ncbi:MAG: hypothetical protein LBU64_09445 [Planctomycetota bacterium]|nr:hypothetical protein [Planctomycetota bacterium]